MTTLTQTTNGLQLDDAHLEVVGDAVVDLDDEVSVEGA
jgi:hypothetical protein